MFTPKGKFGWYELMTSDTKAAGKFYSNVVGWTTRDVSDADGNQYTTFNLGDVGIGGMLHLPGHTAWVGYIAVDDVDAHSYGNLLPTFLACFASPSCPIPREPPL
jgi:uncharacterized protein